MKRETNGLDRRIETNERTVQVLRYKQELAERKDIRATEPDGLRARLVLMERNQINNKIFFFYFFYIFDERIKGNKILKRKNSLVLDFLFVEISSDVCRVIENHQSRGGGTISFFFYMFKYRPDFELYMLPGLLASYE